MEKEILHALDVLAVLAFAVSGALTAMRNKMDIVGIFVVAFISALGGGTLRDLLIGNVPVSWTIQNEYIAVIFLATILSMIFRNKIHNFRKAMSFFDSIGLGIFTIYGAEISLEKDLSYIIAVTMGTVTSIFGGVIRDIICNQIPLVFKNEIYASVSVIAGIIFLTLDYFDVYKGYNYLIVSLFVVIVRTIIVNKRLSLPSIYTKNETGEKELF